MRAITLVLGLLIIVIQATANGQISVRPPGAPVEHPLRKSCRERECRTLSTQCAAHGLASSSPERTSCLPRVEMLRLVEVAVGHVRVVLQARHRKQIVAIRRFPDVHEIRQLLAMIPEVARADLDPPRRPMMGMTGDAQRVLAADLAQDFVGRLIGADVALDVEGDDV